MTLFPWGERILSGGHGSSIDTIGHAQGIGNKIIDLYTLCPFLINFPMRKNCARAFPDHCLDFSSSCCSL